MKINILMAAAGSLAITFGFLACKKDSNSSSSSDPCNPSNKGAKFTQVRSIINSNCGSGNCHLNGKSAGTYNFDCDTSIVSDFEIIAEEVNSDGMPEGAPLDSASKAAINDWIAAGHRITD